MKKRVISFVIQDSICDILKADNIAVNCDGYPLLLSRNDPLTKLAFDKVMKGISDSEKFICAFKGNVCEIDITSFPVYECYIMGINIVDRHECRASSSPGVTFDFKTFDFEKLSVGN